MFTSDINKYLLGYSNNEVIDICNPLFKNTSIDYILYLKLYSDGSRITLTTRNDFLKWIHHENHIISKSVSNINPGIYLPKKLTKLVKFEDSEKINAQIHGARNYFNIDLIENGIYFVFKESLEYCEFFEFGASPCNQTLIDFYLNHIDLLNHFTLYFKNKANKLINQADKNRFKPKIIEYDNTNKMNYSDSPSNSSEFFQSTILSSININHGSIKTHLTKREFECLNYFMGDYALKETGKILNISPRSVEHYLENIKDKLNCHNKSSLIKRTLELNLFNPTYLNWLLSQNDQ